MPAGWQARRRDGKEVKKARWKNRVKRLANTSMWWNYRERKLLGTMHFRSAGSETFATILKIPDTAHPGVEPWPILTAERLRSRPICTLHQPPLWITIILHFPDRVKRKRQVIRTQLECYSGLRTRVKTAYNRDLFPSIGIAIRDREPPIH